MRNKDYIILMADIIHSREYDQYELMTEFKKMTEAINHLFKDDILSPITITLGDEFQCVFTNISSAIKIMTEIEERMIKSNITYKLRYVVLEGQIETTINKVNSHGMMGHGLIEARKKLLQIKKKKNRFNFYLKDTEKSIALYSAFINYQDYVDHWRLEQDYPLVSEYLKPNDLNYRIIASKLKKTPSQIWKREKSLRIEQYKAIKDVINYLGRIK